MTSPRRIWITFAAALSLGLLPTAGRAQPAAIYDELDRIHPVFAERGMVASQEASATRVGLEVLRNGGNAVDAAVAVAFALAVTLPSAGNLGGGGFMLVHDAASGETAAIDYREKAGAHAFRDMFLDAAGEADPERSRYSGLAVGVPGTVAGMALALERYGTMQPRRRRWRRRSRSPRTASWSARISPIRSRARPSGCRNGRPRPGSSTSRAACPTSRARPWCRPTSRGR